MGDVLAAQHEDLSSDPWNPCEKVDVVAGIHNSNAGEVERKLAGPGSLLTSHSSQNGSSRLCQRACHRN